jgi:hypothetical protein
LNCIKPNAFQSSSLESIEIPRNVEILGSSCFHDCESLSSISFESNSRLTRIESEALGLPWFSVTIPSNILFISCDASPDLEKIWIASPDSCPEYVRWQRLRGSGIILDFRRICRFRSNLHSLSDSLFDLSGLIEGSQLSESDEILTHIYQECDDGLSIVVKSINLSGCVDNCHVESTIENLMNLCHPCIASTIGVVLPLPLKEVKIVGMYCGGCSLSEVVSRSPEWWTPTAKAKAVVSLVLGLRFAHSLGLLHGHLTGNNVVFNEDGMIQITDFCMKSLREMECNHGAEADVGGFSGDSWSPKGDVRAFAIILSEIASGTSGGQDGRGPDVPSFISGIIERGQSADSRSTESFADILKTLKENDFQVLEGVDSQKVSNFVSWIDWSERMIE